MIAVPRRLRQRPRAGARPRATAVARPALAAAVVLALPAAGGRAAVAAPLADAVAIGAGITEVCAIRRSGDVVCWGGFDDSAFGEPKRAAGPRPLPIAGIGDAAQIAVAHDGVCVAQRSGRVSCAGRQWYHRSGGGIPQGLLSGITDAVAVAGTGRHRCLLRRAGSVHCWGTNVSGELGGGSTEQRLDLVDVRGLPEPAVEIAVGHGQSCARLRSGAVACWGRRLGLRNPRGEPLLPQKVPGIDDAVSLASGGSLSCVARRSGEVWCWGRGAFGGGNLERATAPARIPDVEGAVTVSVSPDAGRACAVTRAGEVVCWGKGALGDGAAIPTQPQWSPPDKADLGFAPVTRAAGVADAVQVAAGVLVACALTRAGAVSCWGPNRTGEVGRPLRTQDTPAGVKLPAKARQISANDRRTCALLAGGSVACWGAPSGREVVPAAELGKASQVAAGADHTCALLAGGSVACWGEGQRGQLGNRSGESRARPGPTDPPLEGITAIAAGAYHTCALRASGEVLCWGDTSVDRSSPLAVPGLADARQIVAGAGWSAARRKNGEVVRWSDRPRKTAEPASLEVLGALSPATELAGGAGHVCARRADGRMACMGGTAIPGEDWRQSRPLARQEPRFIDSPGDVRQVSVGAGHACWLRASGKAECWGDGLFGQLGRGAPLAELASEPAPVAGLAGAAELASGALHTCARLASGAVVCWGLDNDGRLGGTPADLRPRPVEE